MPVLSGSDTNIAALARALEKGDPEEVAGLVKGRTNLANAVMYWTRHPLHMAAGKGNLEVVNVLLANGANPNLEGDSWETSGGQFTALELAVKFQQPAVARRLLQAGASPNHQDRSLETALGYAFASRQESVAEMLLDHGANPFVENGRKETPLEKAILSGGGKWVGRMLKWRGSGALSWKAGANQPRGPQFVSGFLEQHGERLLTEAVARGELEAVEALVRAGVGVVEARPGDASGITLMQTLAQGYAASRTAEGFDPARWDKLRDFLKDKGCAYDVFAATGFGDLEWSRKLWAADTSVARSLDGEGESLLHWSVKTDQLPMTAFWVKAGAELSATNRAGRTALHLAAAAGLTNHLALLLDAGAPLDLKDTNGWTAFEAATQAKQARAIRVFLAGGKGREIAGRGMATALHFAARNGDRSLLEQAIEDASDVDAHEELGLTSFQVAVLRGHLLAASLLLEAGAKVDARDAEGNTALHLVMRKGPSAIVDQPALEWYQSARAKAQGKNLMQYLVGWEHAGRSPGFNAAIFLLASGADAGATNGAGKTVVDLLTEKPSSIFDDERPDLLKLVGTTGGDVNLADANGDTPLHRAARGDDAGKVEELLAGGANVNAKNRQGRTPLHVAVEKISTWPGTVLPLLQAGADLDARDAEGMTPLHVVALSHGSFRQEATRALLQAGANPNAGDRHERTPVHFFLTGEWPWSKAGDCIAMLVEAGADITATDDQGKTTLHYLAALGDKSPLFFIHGITNLLETAKFDVQARDRAGETPLHVAARAGTMDVYDWLLKHGASPDATNNAGETPLFLASHSTNALARTRLPNSVDIFNAILKGDSASVSNLLRMEPRLVNATNVFGQTPLAAAVHAHRTNLVDLLVQSGAAWDVASAVRAGHVEELRRLLAAQPGAETNRLKSENLLHLAATRGDAESVKLLLAAGWDVNAPDPAGVSPLGMALRSQRADMAALLREHGARENIFDCAYLDDTTNALALLSREPALLRATNAAGDTLIGLAVTAGSKGMFRLLLGREAWDQTSADGRTALHLAALRNRTDMAELWARRKAPLEERDNLGYTPLHLAAANGSMDVLRLLLKQKVNPDAPLAEPADRMGGPQILPLPLEGSTPLHLAALCGQTNAIEVLLKSGASVNATNLAGLTPLDLLDRARRPGTGMPGMSPLLPGMAEPPRWRESNPITLALDRKVVIALLEKSGGKRAKPAK